MKLQGILKPFACMLLNRVLDTLNKWLAKGYTVFATWSLILSCVQPIWRPMLDSNNNKEVKQAVSHIRQMLVAYAAKNNLGTKVDWLERFDKWFPISTTSHVDTTKEPSPPTTLPEPPQEVMEKARTG